MHRPHFAHLAEYVTCDECDGDGCDYCAGIGQRLATTDDRADQLRDAQDSFADDDAKWRDED